MFDGLQTEESQAMDGPMFQELGMIEAMQKPGAVTAAINWYRYAGQHLTAVQTPGSGFVSAFLINTGRMRAGKAAALCIRQVVSANHVQDQGLHCTCTAYL